ncbi:hypothetical protein BC940DRAFT_289517 [Gongronella butleri]|nr:hypothetical protein BC940DRAFT_289517 [Gongronella butleri]
MAPVTSLQYGPMCDLDGCRTQFLMATTMGHARSPNGLWRFRLALPEALNEEQAGQLMENQEQARRVLVDPLQLPTAQDDSSYDARKDTFWASHWSYDHNVVLIGSAKGLTILNGSFDLADRISTKSDVFATQLSASQPRIAWIGCRNGHLALVDSRKPNAEARKPSLRFKHASSITHLRPLDDWASGHGVLAASMNGHVALWDTRFSKRPTRQFIDHRNEHTRNLGFDVDTIATFSVAIAGVDNKVRVWSLLDHQQTVAPAWTSDDFHRPIPSIALQHTPPPRHAAWTHLNHEKHASLPGLLVCTSDQQHTPELHWFSV